MAGALDDLLVIDLGRIVAGPLVGQMLGDLGARVIKVEPAPDGDFVRTAQPRFGPVGSYFATVNRNKESIALDFRSDRGKAVLRALVDRADVLVENFRPGVLEELGFDDDTLAREHPRLVAVRVSAFGSEGPEARRPGVDQLVQGLTGMMSVTGTPETGPIRSGIAVCDLFGGLCATIGALAALVERERSGRGQVVRTSLLEASLAMMTMQAGKYFATGVSPAPEGNHHPVMAPYGLFATADGHIQFQVMHDRQFRALAALCDRPAWLEDPRFATAIDRSRNRAAVRETVAEVMATRGTAEWMTALVDADIACAPVLDVAEAFAHPQAIANGMIQSLSFSDGTSATVPGFPLKLSRTPAELRRPPPLLDEHGAAILRELGLEET